MKVDFNITGIDDVLALLHSLPAEVVSKNGGPVKSGLRKGAKVIQEFEKAYLRASLNKEQDQEERKSTGLLLNNVIVTRGKKPFGTKGERYLVRIKRVNYNRKGKAVTTHQTANLKEYGSAKQAPESFIRRAVQSGSGLAIATATQEVVKGIDRVVKKLARKK